MIGQIRARMSFRERPGERWLAEKHPSEQVFVESVRRWIDGPEGQQVVWNGLAWHLGSRRATRLLRALEAYLAALADGATRKLRRYKTGCQLVSADEALLVDIMRAARRGDHESAADHAAEVVRKADVEMLVERAARLGALLEEIGTDPVSGAEAKAQLR